MANNVRKLKGALERMLNWMEKHTGVFSYQVCPTKENPDDVQKEQDATIALAKSVLSIPLRNCDVGTVEQQISRQCSACENEELVCNKVGSFSCRECFARWSQMPYRRK